jgi:hypothetical protein
VEKCRRKAEGGHCTVVFLYAFALILALSPVLASWWSYENRQVQEMKYAAGTLMMMSANYREAMAIADDDLHTAVWYIEKLKGRRRGHVQRHRHVEG